MNKNSLPVFIIIASVTTALVWKLAPYAREKVPAFRSFAERCFKPFTDAGKRNAPVKFTEGEINEIASIKAQTDAVTDSRAEKSKVIDPGDDDDVLPSLKGVVQSDPRKATWGVINRITKVEGIDGSPIGNVAGGRFFSIASREQTEAGLVLVGNFIPKKFKYHVRIPAENVYCFTGSPDNLSARQRTCLRMYYQRRAEAEDYKAKLMRETGSKSPYFQKAADAVVAFRRKAAEVENGKFMDEDSKRKATYELSRLRDEAVELNRKHKEWKEANAGEQPDPSKDDVYLELLERCKQYAAPIAGMAY